MTIIFREYTRNRMGLRNIEMEAVLDAIEDMDVLESTPDDRPFPGLLIMGHSRNHGPVHISIQTNDGTIIVHSVYIPIASHWIPPEFRKRRYQ